MLEATLRELVAAGLGHMPRTAGVPAAIISEAERRMTTALPSPLRHFYGTVGQLDSVTQSYHHFVPPESLAIVNGGLIFCREHQGQMFWAILDQDLHSPDPPVAQGRQNVSGWDQHCAEASVFLVNFCCWQLLNSMPSIGSTQTGHGKLRKLRDHLKVVSATFGFNMLSFVNAESGMLASALLDIDRLYVGTRSDAALQRLQRASGIELDVL